MTTPTLELEIHSQLTNLASKASDHQLLIDQLENYTDWRSLSFQELSSLCRLYIMTGYSGLLAQTLSLRLSELPKFPWAYFALALKESLKPAEMPEDLIHLLIHSSKMDQSLLELVRADFVAETDPKFEETRKGLLKIRADYYHNLSEELQSQVDLMRSQGLLEQEEKIIQKWLRFFPEQTQATDALNDVRERRFQESAQRSEGQLPIPAEKKSPVEVKILENVEKSQRHILESHPNFAKDFSVAHIFWDNPAAALRFLEDTQAGIGDYNQIFLRVDLHLQSHQYLQALECVDQLEPVTKNRPEILDLCLLYRAKAMWGLQQKGKALELVRILAQQRPDFHAAQLLLDEMEDELR